LKTKIKSNGKVQITMSRKQARLLYAVVNSNGIEKGVARYQKNARPIISGVSAEQINNSVNALTYKLFVSMFIIREQIVDPDE